MAPAFRNNNLHDVESLWCIAVWIIFPHRHQTIQSSVDLQAAKRQVQHVQTDVMLHTRRAEQLSIAGEVEDASDASQHYFVCLRSSWRMLGERSSPISRRLRQAPRSTKLHSSAFMRNLLTFSRHSKPHLRINICISLAKCYIHDAEAAEQSHSAGRCKDG